MDTVFSAVEDHESPPASGFTTEDVEEEGQFAELTCSGKFLFMVLNAYVRQI